MMQESVAASELIHEVLNTEQKEERKPAIAPEDDTATIT